MLFWINLFLGCAIAAILVAISPAVAALYREPRLTGITCALAVPFVFGGLTLQHQALLRRQMRFAALADHRDCFLNCRHWGRHCDGLVGIWLLVACWHGHHYRCLNAAGVWIAMPWGQAASKEFGSEAIIEIRK